MAVWPGLPGEDGGLLKGSPRNNNVIHHVMQTYAELAHSTGVSRASSTIQITRHNFISRYSRARMSSTTANPGSRESAAFGLAPSGAAIGDYIRQLWGSKASAVLRDSNGGFTNHLIGRAGVVIKSEGGVWDVPRDKDTLLRAGSAGKLADFRVDILGAPPLARLLKHSWHGCKNAAGMAPKCS
jgi:hypothetical protein